MEGVMMENKKTGVFYAQAIHHFDFSTGRNGFFPGAGDG